MNGAQHYLEAERLAAAYKDAITAAEQLPDDTPRQGSARVVASANAHTLLDKAQVHATLALAAATAANAPDRSTPGRRAWLAALS